MNLILQEILRINEIMDNKNSKPLMKEELLLEEFLIENILLTEQPEKAIERIKSFLSKEVEDIIDRYVSTSAGRSFESRLDYFLNTAKKTAQGRKTLSKFIKEVAEVNDGFAKDIVDRQIDKLKDYESRVFKGDRQKALDGIEKRFGKNVRKEYELRTQVTPSTNAQALQSKILAKKRDPKNPLTIGPLKLEGIRNRLARATVHSKIEAILDLAFKGLYEYRKNVEKGVDDVFGKLMMVVKEYNSHGGDISAFKNYFRDINTSLQSIKTDSNEFLDWEKTYGNIKEVLRSYNVTNTETIISALKKNNPWKTNHYTSPKESSWNQFWDELSSVRRLRERPPGFKNKFKGLLKGLHLDLKWGTVKTSKEMAYYVDKYGLKGLGYLWIWLTLASKVGVPIVLGLLYTVLQVLGNLVRGKFLAPDIFELLYENIYNSFKSQFTMDGAPDGILTIVSIIFPFNSHYARWAIDAVKLTNPATRGEATEQIREWLEPLYDYGEQNVNRAEEIINELINDFKNMPSEAKNSPTGFVAWINLYNAVKDGEDLKVAGESRRRDNWWTKSEDSKNGLSFGSTSNGKKWVYDESKTELIDKFAECNDCEKKDQSVVTPQPSGQLTPEQIIEKIKINYDCLFTGGWNVTYVDGVYLTGTKQDIVLSIVSTDPIKVKYSTGDYKGQEPVC